jgi:hypothetical protein
LDEATREARALAPELWGLDPDALSIWADVAARQAAIEAIVQAWETGAPTLASHVERVDHAVVAGLRLLDMPRGPVREVRVHAAGRGWAGRKDPGCAIHLDALAMRVSMRVLARPDSVFRTWVHESLHARQPYAAGAAGERSVAPGYEEGLAEGLARVVTRAKAGMRATGGTFDYYVAVYEVLAQVLEVNVELLWRELWQHPTGQVRAAFVDIVTAAYLRRGGRQRTAVDWGRLQSIADSHFRLDRARATADDGILRRLWNMVLR